MIDTCAVGDDVVLESRGVTKRYGATVALNDVSFRVRRGAVPAPARWSFETHSELSSG